MTIDLVVLKTSIPDELTKFYEQLGIKFESHQHGSGPLHYAAELDGLVFEIYPLPNDKGKADDTVRLGFTVDNLDDIIERIKSSGGKILKEPSATEWGYVSIVKDLDGRRIELKDKERNSG